jgi:glutathione synthetase
VAVAYFRSGYSPQDYPTELEWASRALIERATCIKCPTLSYQLAGTKKVQQQLAQPGEVERFLDAQSASDVRACFTGLYDVGSGRDSTAETALAAAIASPEAFVLKPQREGGGNNLHGRELADRLREGDKLDGLVLMQRIRSIPQPAVLVRRGEPMSGLTTSELGVFGTFLAVDGSEGGVDGLQCPPNPSVLLNSYAGHILRTKLEGVDEGGVATGFAVLSSPLLV